MGIFEEKALTVIEERLKELSSDDEFAPNAVSECEYRRLLALGKCLLEADAHKAAAYCKTANDGAPAEFTTKHAFALSVAEIYVEELAEGQVENA